MCTDILYNVENSLPQDLKINDTAFQMKWTCKNNNVSLRFIC